MTEIPAEAENPHISYSQYDTYVSCGEKFRLTRVVAVKEDGAHWFMGGTAIHSATEAIDLKLFEEYAR